MAKKDQKCSNCRMAVPFIFIICHIIAHEFRWPEINWNRWICTTPSVRDISRAFGSDYTEQVGSLYNVSQMQQTWIHNFVMINGELLLNILGHTRAYGQWTWTQNVRSALRAAAQQVIWWVRMGRRKKRWAPPRPAGIRLVFKFNMAGLCFFTRVSMSSFHR